MRKILALFAVLTIGACTNESASRNALDNMGFVDINFTGYESFSCGKGYSYSTGFEATNPRGKRVKGVVCCSMYDVCAVKF